MESTYNLLNNYRCDLVLGGRDDHQPLELHGTQLYAARAVEGIQRADGKQGNLLYAAGKAC